MVNGKNPELYLDQDFVEIQNIIKNHQETSSTFMGKSCDINKINELIVKQIDSYLTNKKTVKTGTPECVPSGTEVEKGSCIKCKKNVKSKSTYCTYGSHWIHYNCERLSQNEIQVVEKSKPDAEYKCKVCNMESQSPNKVQLIIPAAKPLSPNPQDEILLEETTNHEASFDYEETDSCMACGLETISAHDTEVCESCDMVCHKDCVQPKDDLYTCMNCLAYEEQSHGNESFNNVDISDNVTQQPHPTQITGTNASISRIELAETSQVDRLQNITQKPLKKKSVSIQTSIKGREIDERDCKLSDLRARETKMKKMEEEQKIKEKNFENIAKDRQNIDNYVKTIEARNNELELTVKTLQRRIESFGIDENYSNSVTTPNNIQLKQVDPLSGYLNDQIMHVHKRVTAIVMKQIDNQLNKLEESLDLNHGSQSRRTETTTSESQTINTAESANNNSDQMHTYVKA